MASLDRTSSRSILTNNSGDILEVRKVEVKKAAADIYDREYISITINTKEGRNTVYSYDDIKSFFSSDISTITQYLLVSKNIPAIANTTNNGLKEMAVYKDYVDDTIISYHGNGIYVVTLYKRTDAHKIIIQNKEDIAVLYEAIADHYENLYSVNN